MNAEIATFISRLGQHKLAQVGSSLTLCRLAEEGEADVYPRLGPTCAWDTVAAHAILESAGSCVSTLDGVPRRHGKKDVLNSYLVASSMPLPVLRRT